VAWVRKDTEATDLAALGPEGFQPTSVTQVPYSTFKENNTLGGASVRLAGNITNHGQWFSPYYFEVNSIRMTNDGQFEIRFAGQDWEPTTEDLLEVDISDWARLKALIVQTPTRLTRLTGAAPRDTCTIADSLIIDQNRCRHVGTRWCGLFSYLNVAEVPVGHTIEKKMRGRLWDMASVGQVQQAAVAIGKIRPGVLEAVPLRGSTPQANLDFIKHALPVGRYIFSVGQHAASVTIDDQAATIFCPGKQQLLDFRQDYRAEGLHYVFGRIGGRSLRLWRFRMSRSWRKHLQK
jgi:hypothetical protein